ncbi:MAG: T9SS type A sorting domain-containing protein, partial [Planctomycetia bacterium]|nr:T9SS type A sorting domain-containing protein [Planctomycetia bacterium]
NQNAEAFHIYSIHAGDDATNPDWQNWPVDQGAPWVDVDGDGVYDPNVDNPDITGDLFHWYVMNDGNSSEHLSLWNTPPLGIEVRVSQFGEGPDSPLKDVMFAKWEIVNTGGNQLDSMYASVWSDPDIGDANDDLVGCDPELNLGYSYNDFGEDLIYGTAPPAVGYVFLQTPIMPALGDTAWVSGDTILDYSNIPMNAFSMYMRGDDLFGDPETAQQAYNYMNGLIGMTGQPYIDPTTGQPSTFVFNDDPVTGNGWVDYNYYPSGDRRFMMTAGPFSMAPGDTQEVVAAIVIAQGTDNISSITLFRQLAPWIQLAYDTDFSVIGPPLVFSNHIVPTTTDDAIGPYHLEVDVQASSGFELDTNSLIVYYGVENISSVTPLVNGGAGNTFSADVYGNGSAGMFRYYFYVEDTDGNSVYYPPGAPTGYLQFEVGPDQTSPVLGNLTELSNSIYPAGNEAVKITASDRFSLDVDLNYQVNNGSIQNQEMNRILETERYETTLTWSNLILGDQITYWVVAVDGSGASNTAVSDTHTFTIKDSLAIGDWETWQYQSVYHFNLDQNLWSDSAHWYSPRHGRWSGVNLEDLGVEAGWTIIAPIVSVQPDTVISGMAFDIAPFQEASLAFRFACSVENITANVEVAPNYTMGTYYDILDSSILHLLNWTVVDSLVSVGGPGISGDFVEQEVSLSGFNTPLFIRITAQAPAASTPFFLDDIYLKVVHILGTDHEHETTPSTFTLHQNYPNPFNPITKIRYGLPKHSFVNIKIFDLLGREVKTLVSETQDAGYKSVIWDATNDHGKPVSAGVYLYQIRAREFVQTKKMVLLR